MAYLSDFLDYTTPQLQVVHIFEYLQLYSFKHSHTLISYTHVNVTSTQAQIPHRRLRGTWKVLLGAAVPQQRVWLHG